MHLAAEITRILFLFEKNAIPKKYYWDSEDEYQNTNACIFEMAFLPRGESLQHLACEISPFERDFWLRRARFLISHKDFQRFLRSDLPSILSISHKKYQLALCPVPVSSTHPPQTAHNGCSRHFTPYHTVQWLCPVHLKVLSAPCSRCKWR